MLCLAGAELFLHSPETHWASTYVLSEVDTETDTLYPSVGGVASLGLDPKPNNGRQSFLGGPHNLGSQTLALTSRSL